jgi:hypothetical protein
MIAGYPGRATPPEVEPQSRARILLVLAIANAQLRGRMGAVWTPTSTGRHASSLNQYPAGAEIPRGSPRYRDTN